MNANKYGQTVSVKEYEEQLETLRTENYNLRLRIYIMEEKYNNEKHLTENEILPIKNFEDKKSQPDLSIYNSDNDQDLKNLEQISKEHKCNNINIKAFKTIQDLLNVNKRIMKINCQLKKQLETGQSSNNSCKDSLKSPLLEDITGNSSKNNEELIKEPNKYCNEISDLKSELNKKHIEICQLQSQLDSLKLLESDEIISLRSKLVLKNKEVEDLNQQVKKLHHNLQELVNTELWEKNKEISKLILKEAKRKQFFCSLNKSSNTPINEGCKVIYNSSQTNENETSQQLLSYSEVNQLIEKIGNLSTMLQTNDSVTSTVNYEQLKNRYIQVVEELEAMKWKQKETSKSYSALASHLDELSVFLDVISTNFSESKKLKNELDRMIKSNKEFSKSLTELLFKGSDSNITHVPVLPDYSEINFFSCDEISPSEELIINTKHTSNIFDKHFGNDSLEKNNQNSDNLTLSNNQNRKENMNEDNESDNWSEPDKYVSSTRIGLTDLSTIPNTISDSSEDDLKENEEIIHHKEYLRRQCNSNRVSIKITKEEYKRLKSALQFFTKYSEMLFQNSACERNMEKLVLVNAYLREINDKNMEKIKRLVSQVNNLKTKNIQLQFSSDNVLLNQNIALDDQKCAVSLSDIHYYSDQMAEQQKAENILLNTQLEESRFKLEQMKQQLETCRITEKELVEFKETYCKELKIMLDAEMQNKFDIFSRNYEILSTLVEKTMAKIKKLEDMVKEISTNFDSIEESQSEVSRLTNELQIVKKDLEMKNVITREYEGELKSVTELLKSTQCQNEESLNSVSYLNDVITCKSKLIDAYQDQRKTLESKMAELETELNETLNALSMRERENKELYLILLQYEKEKEKINNDSIAYVKEMNQIKEEHRHEILMLTKQLYEYKKEEEGNFAMHMNVLDELPKQIELLKLNKQKWQEMFEKSENDKNHFKSMLELILNLSDSKSQCFTTDSTLKNQKDPVDQVF
ncbi:centrosomin isoform X2 [Daktulosphaira vitifoliae]|nr:centrosomin isoform X2 [Daktulosphaira vitifoliae]